MNQGTTSCSTTPRFRPRRPSVLNNNACLGDRVLCYSKAIEMNHPSVIIQRLRLKLCDSASPTLRTGGWRLKAVLLVAGERMRAAARRASSSARLRASASAAALACACAWGCVVSCQLCRDSKICESQAVPSAWGCVLSCQLCRGSKICECQAEPNLEMHAGAQEVSPRTTSRILLIHLNVKFPCSYIEEHCRAQECNKMAGCTVSGWCKGIYIQTQLYALGLRIITTRTHTLFACLGADVMHFEKSASGLPEGDCKEGCST
jgi:hypothetical protein